MSYPNLVFTLKLKEFKYSKKIRQRQKTSKVNLSLILDKVNDLGSRFS